jgi:hypothetical protein
MTTKDYNLSWRNLTKLKGLGKKKVNGLFDCSHNDLSNLIGGPQEVEDDYYCNSNKLISLKGSPKRISGVFDCSENKLKNLTNSPQEVDNEFICRANNLVTLDGALKKINGGFDCRSNENLPLIEIIKFIMTTDIVGEIRTDYKFDFKKFKKLNNRKRIKMIFEEFIKGE